MKKYSEIKMNKTVREILHWTWELPQTLVGLVCKFIFKGKKYKIITGTTEYDPYVWNNTSGSISLGKYIFVSKRSQYNLDVVKHEFGHQVQSLYLGPLYLLVVGVPSIIWANCFGKYRAKNNVGYFDVYPENWANELGEVE